MSEYRGAALRLLWWATLVELVLVRVVSRVGIFIPKTGVVLSVYQVLMSAGEVAFSFSLFMGVILLGLALAGHRWWGMALGVLAGVMVMIVTGPVPSPAWSLGVALVLAAAVAVMGIASLRSVREPWECGLLSTVLTVHLVGYLTTVGQLAWTVLGLPGEPPLAGAALRAGELLAAVAPIWLAVPLLRAAWAGAVGLGRAAALGATGAAALALAYTINADLTAILAMYSLGFTLSWPAALYLAALGLGLPGLAAAVRRNPDRGLALGLLFLAGYSLGVNQQHLIVLAGWALLGPPAPAAAPRPSATEEVTLA
ncbi:MAG: hypothetical protein K0R39_2194 [Symbiobacteriaceae bacterium]|nr:hypothetical protein [Symbiobacteriaceae bacterium]